VEWLIKDAERVFPQLRGVNWSYRWGGKVALTEDRLPHLHEPKPGLIVGLGYNGRGVAISNIMGKVLAKRVLGANPNELPFPTSPIMKIPFRSLKKTLEGPAIWFLRLLDYLESR
jgi:glycine/D-amino acid oxidase-like deaminating enzyme